MGADGGYVYVKRSDLKRVLSETEIDLWLRFVSHSLGRDAYREDVPIRPSHSGGVGRTRVGG